MLNLTFDPFTRAASPWRRPSAVARHPDAPAPRAAAEMSTSRADSPEQASSPDLGATSRWWSQWLLLLLSMLWAVLLLGGCSGGGGTSGGGTSAASAEAKLEVLTTTGMVRDLTDALLADDVRVSAIMGPGVDPHLYQPTRTDAVRLLNADLVVYNGLHLEGRLTEVLERRRESGKPTLAVGDGLPADRLLKADAGLYDPHIWMDVSLWYEAAEGLAKELIAWRPERAAAIEQSLSDVRQQLAELDRWSEQTLATVPEKQRVLITAHDAFRYFGRRYGLEVHGVQGVSTISEAAISDTNRLVDLIIARNIPAVFFESSVSPRQVQAIIEGARRSGMQVSSDATLYSDSLGAAGSATGTYVGVIEHNVRTIATALGGQPLPFPQRAAASEGASRQRPLDPDTAEPNADRRPASLPLQGSLAGDAA